MHSLMKRFLCLLTALLCLSSAALAEATTTDMAGEAPSAFTPSMLPMLNVDAATIMADEVNRALVTVVMAMEYTFATQDYSSAQHLMEGSYVGLKDTAIWSCFAVEGGSIIMSYDFSARNFALFVTSTLSPDVAAELMKETCQQVEPNTVEGLYTALSALTMLSNEEAAAQE